MSQPIDTTVTLEDQFAVVDPISSAPPGSDIEAYVEEGVVQLPLGGQVVTVTFLTPKVSPDYQFDVRDIYNMVDATPLVIDCILTNFTVTGFEITLSASPDTGNYYFRWKVRIPTAIQSGITITAQVAGIAGGSVQEVFATGNDGVDLTVGGDATKLPNVIAHLIDGGIPLAKLAETVVTGPVLTPTGAQTVTNKLLDGNNNTFQNIGLASLIGDGIIAQNLTDPNNDQGIIWDNGTKLFRFAGSPTNRGLAKDVYISTRGDGNGVGTLDDPFDGSTSVLFDAIMADNTKTPVNTNIYLCAGTFLTKGFTVRTGWKFHLTPQTTLKLDVFTAGDAAALGAPKIVSMFGGTNNTLVQDVLIEGGIWDLNMQNQTQALCPAAIQVVADGFTARNMKVINFGNTSPTNAECFVLGVFSNGARDGIIHKRGVLWDNIEITQPASGVTNVATLSLTNTNGGQAVVNEAALSSGWFEGVTIRNCYIHDITFSDAVAVACINLGGWVKGFHGHNNRFARITGNNARYGYYLDTGSVQDVKIEDGQADTIMSAVNLNSGTGWTQNNISIKKQMVVSSNFIPIAVNSQTGTTSNVYFESNTIIAPGGSPATGIAAVGITNSNFLNNTIDSSSANAIFISGGNVSQRFNNRQLDGTPVSGETGLGDLIQVQTTSVTTGTVVMLANKSVLRITAALTGALQITLPLASSIPAGNSITILDPGGFSSDVNVLFVARSGSDTINGSTSPIIALIGQGSQELISDGVSKWTFGTSYIVSPANLYLEGGNATVMRTAGTDRWYVNSSGHVITVVDNAYNLGESAHRFKDAFFGGNVNAGGHILAEGANVVLGTSTGSQIATVGGASGQKLAVWGKTPIVQPVLATGAGHTADDIITVLQNIGWVRQS
jgi:hypothetical protein